MKTITKNFVFFSTTLILPPVIANEQAIELETIEVISVTPLQGSSVDIDKIPSQVQTATAEELEKSQSLSLADYLNQHLGSVHINEAQNNPLQPDIYYRGFVASPLQGMPQGLSVYVNGVRFNEPFGDSVNWDLIPKGAIDSIALYPGSNPMYGLNSLGGALSIQTKTGFSAPKHQLEVYGGSWDRHSEELTSGWNNGTWGYFIDLHNFGEQGWRDHSRSSAKQVFGTLSWRNDQGALDLTLAANDNTLKGNGASPIQLFEQQRKAIFTHPDITKTRMLFAELSGNYDLNDDITVSANTYFRQNRMSSLNGDDSDYDECSEDDSLLCDEDDEAVIDINDNFVDAEDAVEGATNNTSQTYMRSYGGSIQSAFNQDLFGHENNLVVGGSFDYATVHFESNTELAELLDDRGTRGSGIEVKESRVRLNTATKSYSLFFSDHFSITKALTVMISGRYNHTRLTMKNQFIDGEDKLSGSHSFDRFNPAVGLTYQVAEPLTLYGSYSESSRVPTPMELSCADEDDPCKLPNAFIADPPLAQVVAKTWEAGFRGNLSELMDKGDLNWNLGFFHTTNHNDIIFNRGGDSISEGFFSNIGQTRRYGIEAGMSVNYPRLFSEIDDWSFSTNYTYLNARFLDSFVTQNPLDNDEASLVTRGDRIPGLPEHIFKASVGVDLWQRWSIALDTLYSGDQFFRGDEANETSHLGGYWVFNARTEVEINKYVTLFGSVNNIFDRQYKSFGVYGDADEVLGDDYDNGQFVSPGAPRAGWVGIRLTL